MIRRILAISLITLATSSCGAPRSSLGTEASTCFRDVPVATAAAAGSRLVGVRRIRADHARDALGPEGITASAKTELCVFAFHHTDSSDTAGQTFTIVVIDDHQVAAVRHVDRLPIRFHHLS